MNKDLKDKASQLNDWLLAQEEVKEFLKFEKIIKEHPELSSLEEELKEMQMRIVNDKSHDIGCDEVIEEYNKKRDLFFNNPVVFNYLSLKDDVNSLVQQINSIINDEIRNF